MSQATRTRALVVSLVGLSMIFLLQVTVNRHRIENLLTERALQELAAGSYGQVEVDFTGQDASLTVAEPGRADGAAAVVASVPGVRTVTVVTGIGAPTPGSSASGRTAPPPLIIELKDGVARARGSMPSAASVAALTAAVKGRGRTADTSEITIDHGLAGTTDTSPDWMDRLTSLVSSIPEHDAVVLDFTTGILGLSGTVATEDEHASILDAAARLVPRSAEAADGLEVAGK